MTLHECTENHAKAAYLGYLSSQNSIALVRGLNSSVNSQGLKHFNGKVSKGMLMERPQAQEKTPIALEVKCNKSLCAALHGKAVNTTG